MSWFTNSFPWASSLSDFYTQTAIPNAPKHTGRLPLSDQETRLSVPPAVLFAPEPSLSSGCVKENIQYKHSNTPLNEMFFSQENMDRLQQMIHDTVFQMVGADIGKQSEPDLMLVMRSYYLTYAENVPGSEMAELEQLNNRVVSFCSNRIAVEVEAYRYYRKDILDFPAPIAQPIDTHIYGTRTGELKSFF
jgi:hypothetical protein